MEQPNTTTTTAATTTTPTTKSAKKAAPRLAVRLTLDTLPARDRQPRYWLSVYSVTRTGTPSTAKTALHQTFGVCTFAEFLAAYALDPSTRLFINAPEPEASC